MMALLFTRTEIHLQDCSEMAEDIMGRWPMQMGVTYLRARRPDASISRNWYLNPKRSALIWFGRNSEIFGMMTGTAKALSCMKVAGNMLANLRTTRDRARVSTHIQQKNNWTKQKQKTRKW
jgi:hypothetical protein